ncbi:MAG: hypothetical protein GY754_18280 [bacterium]|nr:hypothetical protein [bacterium]
MPKIRVRNLKGEKSVVIGRKNTLQISKVKFYVRFLYYNPIEDAYLDLPAGVDVALMDHDPIHGDETYGTAQTTGKEDLPIEISYLDRKKAARNPDLYLLLKTGSRYIDLNNNRIITKEEIGKEEIGDPPGCYYAALPKEIHTRNKQAINHQSGFLEDYEGKGEGGPGTDTFGNSKAWTFKLEDARIFGRLQYHNEKSSSLQSMPPNLVVTAYDFEPGTEHEFYGAANLQENGNFYLPVFMKDESKPGVSFSIKNKRDIYLDKENGTYNSSADGKWVKLPRSWESKKYWDSERKAGIRESWKGLDIGSPAEPWTFTYIEEALIEITGIPVNFAPSIETCLIRYSFVKEPGSTGNEGVLFIKDRDGKPVRTMWPLELEQGSEGSFEWDGTDDSGNYAGPGQSPFTVLLQLQNRSNVKDEKQTAVEIEQLDLNVQGLETHKEKKILLMNDPEREIEVSAVVRILQSNGTGAAVDMEIPVEFTVIDPSSTNTAPAGSYRYGSGDISPRYLGKESDSEYWRAGTEKYKTGYKTVTEAGSGKAECCFLPSGVGGDQYRIKAAVGELITAESEEFTIWRSVSLDLYQAAGKNHISTNSSNSVLSGTGYFDETCNVLYTRGAVTDIPGTHSGVYIGLWDFNTGTFRDWDTWKAKQADEIPAEGDSTAEVRKKAQKWVERIAAQFYEAMDHWPAEAGIPPGSIIGIDDIHPKFSAHAPDSDALTGEWDSYPDLKIRVFGNIIHPDQPWARVQTITLKESRYIPAGLSGARIRALLAHEIAHRTKEQFERTYFAQGKTPVKDRDHSPAAGIMDTTASGSAFNNREKQVLRGEK